MPSISGVQLCRLLCAEPATADVPVILCGDGDDPRNRFWAERAGAAAYVIKGRTAELVSALAKTVHTRTSEDDSFFVQLSGGSGDIRDRLARHLDAALFDSVIAAELRALANAGTFDRLFDRLAQFMSQVLRYRWIALASDRPERFAIHRHPDHPEALAAARETLRANAETVALQIEDEDAVADHAGPDVVAAEVFFDGAPIARFACAPAEGHDSEAHLQAGIVSRELGGALRIVELVEKSQRLATTDLLTGLMNRRAFAAAMATELARTTRHGYALSLAILDVDHFKHINDGYGHACGDRVLAALGALLRRELRREDMAARWGGEEFVITFPSTDREGSHNVAERVRAAVEAMQVEDPTRGRVPVTASIGVATWMPGESLDTLVEAADRAMYASKTGGRNRVTVASPPATPILSRSLPVPHLIA